MKNIMIKESYLNSVKDHSKETSEIQKKSKFRPTDSYVKEPEIIRLLQK